MRFLSCLALWGILVSTPCWAESMQFDWPEKDVSGSLRLRFRLDGVASTFALPSRAAHQVAQTLLLDTPRFRVNLNVDRTKTTLHFFLFAEEAQNGDWALYGVDRLDGVPDGPFKVGVVDLSHLKGGRDYELWINWDLEALTLLVWLNGELQGDPFTANRRPWIPARPPRDAVARVQTALYDGEHVFPIHVLAAEAFSSVGDATDVLASAASLARLESEGRVVFSAPLNLDGYDRQLRYAADFSVAHVQHETELFDEENQRVRLPEPGAWVLEGAARARATPEGLQLETRPDAGDVPIMTATAGHFVIWAPVTLPENFLLEYDFEPESPRRGLHILFWNAQARGQTDIFDLDAGLPARDGVFSAYTWQQIHSYHASVFATDDEEPRRVANLRKNSGFVLAACGDDGVYGVEGPVRIRLLRDGADMHLEANGREVMRFHDDGQPNGPPLHGGRFGFRLMAHTGAARIDNVRLYELTPRSSLSGGSTWLHFQGREEDAIPSDWTIHGDAEQSYLHQDPLVEGRGYLRLLQAEEAPTTLTIPLSALEEDGRVTLRMSVRSPQSKWFQLTLTRGGQRIWSHHLALGRHWRDEALEFSVAAGAPAELSLSFYGAGRVDVESLESTFWDTHAVADAMAQRERPGHFGNLLRNSRLWYGMPSGWHLHRYADDERDVEMALDPDVTGPSGYPAFHMRTARETSFFTEPIAVVHPGKPHTAALTLQGTVQGYAQLFQDGVPASERVAFSGGADWHTVHVPFTPAPLAQLYTLRVDIDGDVWFDEFHVYADAHPPVPRADVALCTERFSRIVFHDEPLSVQWSVTGAPADAVLRAQLHNLYGEKIEWRPIPLTGEAVQSGALDADLFPERPLGQFRVEARVETITGEPLSPWSEWVVSRVKRPVAPDTSNADSPFGVHVPRNARHLEMARAIGLRWVRLHDIGGNEWFRLEPKPGEWRFDDAAIHRYHEAGFQILGVLVSSPLWANAWPDEEKPLIHGFWDKFGMPGDLGAFAQYVKVFTQRYRDTIAAHEVWNEPWVPRFFSGRREVQPVGEPEYYHSENPQHDYAQLSHAARAGAGSEVLLAGLNSSAGATLALRVAGTDWTRGVLAADGIAPVDIVTYHHYTPARLGYPDDDVEAGFQRAIGPLLEAGLQPRVWMSEGSNTPGGLPGTFYHHTLPRAADFQPTGSADALLRYVVALLAAGNEKIFLYSMHAHGLWGRQDRFTTLVQPDGYLHPDAVAFSALTHALEGTRFVAREQGEDQATRYWFERPAHRVQLIAPHPDHPIVPPEGALDVWGNPARDPQCHLMIHIKTK